MSRSKKNWDFLIDYYGNYLDRVDPAVSQLLAGRGIKLNPPAGLGIVTISIDENEVLLPGDNISDLVNDLGYLTEVESLDDIKDVTVPSPQDGQALVWSGAESKWVAARQKLPSTFRFRGAVDCSIEHAEADPEIGWVYIQAGTDAAEPLESWTGIFNRETINIKDLIVYGTNDRWQRVENTFELTTIFDLEVVNKDPDPAYPQGRLEFDDTTTTLNFYQTERSWLPNVGDDSLQSGTLDDRYVNTVGDTMSGDLSFTNSAKVNFKSDIHQIVFNENLSISIDGYPTPSFSLTEYGFKLHGKSFSCIDENNLVTLEVVGETGGPLEIGGYLTTIVDHDESLVNKKYVDDLTASGGDGKFVLKTGDTMSGPLELGSTSTATGELKIYSQGSPNRMLFRATADETPGGGGGDAVYNGRITENNHIITKKYFDDKTGKHVLKAGDTMTGDLEIAKSNAALKFDGPGAQTIQYPTRLQFKHTASGNIVLEVSNQDGVEVRRNLSVLADDGNAVLHSLIGPGAASSSISYSGKIVEDEDLVNKKYVDEAGGAYLPLAGGHVTGEVKIGKGLDEPKGFLLIAPQDGYDQSALTIRPGSSGPGVNQTLINVVSRFDKPIMLLEEGRLMLDAMTYFHRNMLSVGNPDDESTQFSADYVGAHAGTVSNPFIATEPYDVVTKHLLDSRLVVSDNPPTPIGNKPILWFDSSEDSLSSYIYYDDAWVPFSVPPSVTSTIVNNSNRLNAIRDAAATATDFESFRNQILTALS